MTEPLVKPELPGGFKDYSSRQVLARQRMMRSIETVYRRFGFVPLQTSIAQRRPVLTGGKSIENRLWDMRVDKSAITTDPDLTVTARFDLTVPLARYVAANIGTIVFPFRRYEFGDVFRGETPQAGRYCEFMQFDADIVGAALGPADAEIIACMYAVMRALGIERFLIKVNDRKVLNGFAERVGFQSGSKSAAALLRVMDKADKIGLDGVLAELSAKEAPEGEEEVFSFDAAKLDMVSRFMALTEGLATNADRLSALKEYFGGEGVGAEGVAELELIAMLVTASGVPEDAWVIDAMVARGLGYYTGPVFETVLLEKPEFGSVYSGGRFDDLVARFTGESLPSVGASVGVDRLFAALESLGAVDDTEPDVDVFIITMDRSLMADYFAMAAELRAAGVSVEINMNYQDSSNRAQMGFGLSRRAPILLFYGTGDAAKGTVGVKNTATKAQESVPRSELVAKVLTVLGRSA
ncbi:histidine--tRNA ligase [Candidatus Uhrbacteria bacterium RIFOXYB12_FULL_58_10]|uniref:Histidine--tRNA ligase n=1 Tax=Candidatus Uhrbacteria bacterium RIFOXYB2_FULL_57_15 TaxID=1802422 RepID=A0A1F7W776_9BACT|nr:MAG: histidine--tRNA ligase [Candidatus Uhrbacteria bacterium RIFOXYB12_FULL_58_10]OGL98653.1 MAG: histidine--tRNA ligase [Candidatus Uhrbacteria bacterium RIFOXYB2_FULL_57_15]OGM00002.1 MAG: histidine--tRNA ligase [Candidatus Uhrbacteria bacterium RIFOXYC12_FULL_57_11]